MPAPGDRIGRRYECVREIGSGGMGTVYEARHLDLSRRVAIKVLAWEALAQPGAFERFRREARVAAQLRSAHVAKALDVDTTEDGLPFMVLELLEGDDLSAEIARGPLPIRTAVDYARQALEALSEAHSYGIVHRDIKPANLFVCNLERGATRRAVKVLDFGIAKAENVDRITRTFDSFGTPEYMSPEQIRATRDADARSDIWAIGVVLYECLTGRVPFGGTATNVIASVVSDPVPRPSALRADIPPGLEAALLKALEKEESARYQTAAHFRNALSPWAPTGTLAAPQPTSYGNLSAPLGTVLVQTGRITAEQLVAALERQRHDPTKRLGDALVEMGACSRADIEAALALAVAPLRPPQTRQVPVGTALLAETESESSPSAGIVGALEEARHLAINVAPPDAISTTAPAASAGTELVASKESATSLPAEQQEPPSSGQIAVRKAAGRVAHRAAGRRVGAARDRRRSGSHPQPPAVIVAASGVALPLSQTRTFRRTAAAGFVGTILALLVGALIATFAAMIWTRHRTF